jgi:hypothetical protein
MKSNQRQPKFYMPVARSICAILFLISVFISCQKEYKRQASTNEFNETAAKEWYYGIFKKSPEWINSPSRGKQLPDWKKSTYRKVGNMEIIEFPLVKARAKITIPKNNSLTENNIKRIAEASLVRIAFIKKSGNVIFVREIDYIPDWDYIQKKGFDISSASLAKDGDDFSGRIIIKNWDGNELSRMVVKNGVITHKGALTKPGQSNGKDSNRNSAVAESGCEPEEVCEYEQDCEQTCYGDHCTPWVCGEWEPTGNCLPANNCPKDPCDGLSSEECMCQVFGCGDDSDGGGGNTNTCNIPSNLNDVLANAGPVSENLEIDRSTEVMDVNGDITRTWKGRWNFYKGTWLTYHWSYKSFDEGVHKKIGDVWKWVSLTHISHSQIGTSPFNTTCTMNVATPTISNDRLEAYMTLEYEVKVCVECLGVGFGCTSQNAGSTSAVWKCN